MPFAKGHIANPHGRPPAGKGLTERLRMRVLRDDKFINKTIALAMKGHPTALKEIWERVDGKVAQPVQGSIDSKISITLQWASQPDWLKSQDSQPIIEVQADDSSTSD